MTKPLFASKWFKDVPAAELRQEIQNLYRIIGQLTGDVEEEVTTREAADTELQKDVADLRTDITSLEEDVTALDTDKVNRAGDTIAGDLNVLGALLHNGNAVVEYGSNANGEYVRFADGTQICWATDRAWTTDANGNDSWTFPAAFIAPPACWGQSLSPAYDVREFRSSSTANSMRVKIVNSAGNNYSSQPVTAHLFAIGRWK